MCINRNKKGGGALNKLMIGSGGQNVDLPKFNQEQVQANVTPISDIVASKMSSHTVDVLLMTRLFFLT